MAIIATLGPVGSDGYLAAKQYLPDAEIKLFNRLSDAVHSFVSSESDYALIPVYNTRQGEVKEYFRSVSGIDGYWVDNVVLPIHLSLAKLDKDCDDIDVIVGKSSVFRQCEDYIDQHFPDATLMAVNDIESALREITENKLRNRAVIESEELVKQFGFHLAEREVVSHNRTRFAVMGKKPADSTGYDATALITRPLQDRVGMLADILGEFTRRGINIIDLQSENDIQTQKLRIYIEFEGHISHPELAGAVEQLERKVIQEEGSVKLLGSFPRIDMRIKQINTYGFIGSGAMSRWFASP